MTGESVPATVGPGHAVTAGSVNLHQQLHVRVEASGHETRLAQLAQLVSDAAQDKPRIVQFADRISGWFVIAVSVAALMTLAAWWHVSPTTAAQHATALLIVACPCALGIATPLTLAIAIGRSAQRHIFIKTGYVLELLAQRGTLILDKTGTLTHGSMAVTHWWGDPDAQPLTAALEAQSTHPIARALAAVVDGDLPPVEQITHQPRGVIGQVEGHSVAVGSPAFVSGHADISSSAQQEIQRALDAAQTPIAIAINGQVTAIAHLSDTLRPDAAASIDQLRQLGWHPVIASGDQPTTVHAIAAQLDIPPAEAHGNLTPEQKLKMVQAHRDADPRPVVMVGDGVNDAAALAAASVGLAVHGGAEAALGAADAYFATSGLERITALVRAAKRTLRTIRIAMSVSLAYNLTFVTLAAAGLISPLVAAVLMPASSFSVIATALARRNFDEATS